MTKNNNLYKYDTPYKTPGNYKYQYVFVKYHHVSKINLKKSIWAISLSNEICLYSTSITTYIEPNVKDTSFAFLLSNGSSIVQVGFEQSSKKRPLYLAKFKTNNFVGHGYPADYVAKIEDKPSHYVLDEMEKNGLSKMYARRIRKAQPLK